MLGFLANTLLDTAEGQATQYTLSYTQCPAQGAGYSLVASESECGAAAAAIGASYSGLAGSDWVTGCIYHVGSVWYSPYSATDTDNPSDAYVCQTTGLAAITFVHCLPGTGMIESEADCIAAAAAVGVSYASNAGTEWASGCLYHNGNAYYSPHVNGTTQNPTDAYICNAASTCAPVGYWVVPTSVSERVPRSRKTFIWV